MASRDLEDREWQSRWGSGSEDPGQDREGHGHGRGSSWNEYGGSQGGGYGSTPGWQFSDEFTSWRSRRSGGQGEGGGSSGSGSSSKK